MVKDVQHKVEGHRKRLRDRFLQSGFEGFLDYEIIELLLTLGTPRRDCKQMAKEAIKKFKGLTGVLDATTEDLQQIQGIGQINAFGIKLSQAVSERYTKENISNTALLHSPELVVDYLHEKIGKKAKEHFVLLCLDTRNNLIVDDVSVGVLNASLVHPREVFRKAISVGAAKVIVAHNHPSGDPTPSKDDLMTAERIKNAGNILGIVVLEQFVITRSDFCSLN
ncbi:MAG: DNA repair protein RadC [bacterium]